MTKEHDRAIARIRAAADRLERALMSGEASPEGLMRSIRDGREQQHATEGYPRSQFGIQHFKHLSDDDAEPFLESMDLQVARESVQAELQESPDTWFVAVALYHKRGQRGEVPYHLNTYYLEGRAALRFLSEEHYLQTGFQHLCSISSINAEAVPAPEHLLDQGFGPDPGALLEELGIADPDLVELMEGLKL